MAKQPLKYDWIGEWFLTRQAQRLGLAFTILFSLGCVPDIISTFAPRCSIFHKLVIAPRVFGTYKAQTKCDQPLQLGAH